MKQLFCLLVLIFLFSCNQNDLSKQETTGNSIEVNPHDTRDFPPIGDQIINAREKKGLSQNQLAEATGLSKQNMSDIEQNRAIPTRELVVSIQKVLDCEIILD